MKRAARPGWPAARVLPSNRRCAYLWPPTRDEPPPFEPPLRTVDVCAAGFAGVAGLLGLLEPFEPPLRVVDDDDFEPPRRAVPVDAFGFQPPDAGFVLADDDLLPPLRVVLDVLLVDLLPPERTVGLGLLVTRVIGSCSWVVARSPRAEEASP